MAEQEQGSPTTRERILMATIDFIEKEGPEKATTRSIAAAAGVNIAAINYYYRSKEALLEAALASSWEHALSHLRPMLAEDSKPPREILAEIASFLLDGGYRFPAITRATIFDGECKPRPSVAASVASLSAEILSRLMRSAAKPDEERLRAKVAAFLSAVMFPPLASALLPWLDGADERRLYAEVLVESLLDGEA
jgi:TetR/AcrR family transcriptional regulator, regulator of cefoperazone and chloramphenicol sensitivity